MASLDARFSVHVEPVYFVYLLQVICGKCSSKRAPLAYLEDRKERVCTECYAKILPSSPVVCDVPPSPSADDKTQRKAPLVLQVVLYN